LSTLSSLRPPAYSFAAVLVHLFGARPFHRTSSGELQTTCPWHDDHVPSLWVNDERGLCYCHACGAGGSARSVMKRRLGSSSAARTYLHDIAPTLPPVVVSRAAAAKRGPGRGRARAALIDDVYPSWGLTYDDLRYVKVKLDPRDYRIYHLDTQGRFIPGMGGRAGVLFAMPLLAEARASDMAVLEGEKDVLRAWEVGIPATCNPEGAGKWREAYSWSLAGLGVRRVYVVPDNDAPGRAHAKAVVASCRGIGLQAFNVGALPGVPPKGDLSDFLDMGHTAADVRLLMRAARRKGRA
jgi:hypothetical protein